MAKGNKKAGKHGFQKGKSGNPGGRPRIAAEVIEACRALSMEAIEVLVEIMKGGKGIRPTDRRGAAEAILDRAWGKATQPVQLGTEGVSDEDLLEKVAEAMAVIAKGAS